MLKRGRFIRRINRFAALADVDGQIGTVHVPNSGRLAELLIEGAPVILRQVYSPLRKTDYDLLLVGCPDAGWVMIDAITANQLMYDYIKEGRLKELPPYQWIKKEVVFGNSRFDIAVGNGHRYYIEVKCVTLVKDGVAMFPDAPTQRGKKHMRELITARQLGCGAGVVFVVQRGDAAEFSPHWDMDRDFGLALKEAYENGVDIYAFSCDVTEREIDIKGPIPVKI